MRVTYESTVSQAELQTCVLAFIPLRKDEAAYIMKAAME